MGSRNTLNAAKAIQIEVDKVLGPPEDGAKSRKQLVIPFSVVRGTRGYIERVTNQANGCFEKGWYDACAVMIRRLLETLIIEAFEKFNIASRIKNASGDFYYLGDLINASINETAWNLSRNCKQSLPRLKSIGDKSAHSRRFVAQRGDIEPILDDIRVAVQEFVFLADLK